MDFLDLARERYSVRRYSDQKVEKEKIEKLIEAARIAPTAVNLQPQRILVVDSEEGIKKLEKSTPFMFGVNTAFVIFYDKGESWKQTYNRTDYGPIDAGVVATHILLEATQLDLGAVFVGHFKTDVVCEEFDVPEFLVPIAIIHIGYPAENSRPAKLHTQKKDISETVFYNSLDGVKPGVGKDYSLD